jgi:hypothetical protein
MIFSFVIGLGGLGDKFEAGIWAACSFTQSIALLVIPIGIMARVGVSILNYFTGQTSTLSLHKVFQSIVIFFFVVSYKPIMSTFSDTVDVIETYIRDKGSVGLDQVFTNAVDVRYLNQEELNNVKERIRAGDTTAVSFMRKLQQNESTQSNFWKSITSVGSAIADGAKAISDLFTIDILQSVINAVSRGITAVLRLLLFIFQIFLVSALLVVGPLAAMIHSIPIIGDGVLKHWFRVFLTYKFWGITMAVVDIMIDQYLKSVTTQKSIIDTLETYAYGNGISVIVNIAFIILFIMTPKITSWYMNGHSDSGITAMMAAGSTVLNVASGAGKVGAAVASGGVSAGAGVLGNITGGGAVQNAQMISTFKNLTNAINSMNSQKPETKSK